MNVDDLPPIRPRRKITGMSAVLLPFTDTTGVDWEGYCRHVNRTADCGLIPAVNMDTGYTSLLDDNSRVQALDLAHEVLGKRPFAAGAFVADCPGDRFNLDAYRRAVDQITERGGTPVVFQSYGLTQQESRDVVESYERIGETCGRFIAFELDAQFAPFGRIYDLDLFRRLMQIPACFAAKHSSLRRQEEWDRLRVRDRLRPEFVLLSGNDLAIDMVMYGSDYLLGLSTFGPDWFAARDALWASGENLFFQLNDLLQYLGWFAFRRPVPAYRHSAAQMLRIRNWTGSDRTHPLSPQRPASDLEILREIKERVESQMAALPSRVLAS